MPHCKAKRPRLDKHAACIRQTSNRKHCDWMVMLPSDKDKAARLLTFQQLLNRLEFLGYSSIALVHQVYGKPSAKITNADSIFEPYEQIVKSRNENKATAAANGLQIHRRLHVVMENLSDLSIFHDTTKQLTASFDLLSVAPSNETIFQAACACATVDLITLDYSKSGLNYKVRSNNVQTAMANKIGLEVLYGPAILSVSSRKHFCQTLRAIKSGTTKKGLVVVSSGGHDVLALRSPGDIANVLETVALADPVAAREAMAATWVLEDAMQRRRRRQHNTNATDDSRGSITVRIGTGEEVEESASDHEPSDSVKVAAKEDRAGLEDGFITL